jgi:hypothetical protein
VVGEQSVDIIWSERFWSRREISGGLCKGIIRFFYWVSNISGWEKVKVLLLMLLKENFTNRIIKTII